MQDFPGQPALTSRSYLFIRLTVAKRLELMVFVAKAVVRLAAPQERYNGTVAICSVVLLQCGDIFCFSKSESS
jgi:hypothetical protein